ncbi:hypothetical protein G6030_15355 [Dietzia sp. E1]|uniref:DUF6114 domain-containing protein n=1 Tax=Dietzia TaxID=37914 RepID=UPI0015FE3D8F|nr:DUF6114 domain-containing protein [Dietzia massiliensis]MBB1022646.1 hypothetical protein [Dietzia sp. E1]MBS7549497.1 hypothetical protein [Dietzia massiliensis]
MKPAAEAPAPENDRPQRGADRPVAAAILQIASGVVVLAVVLGVASFDGLAISFSATSTPMALFIGCGLIACGVSTWAQPTTRILTGLLGFAFSLVALPGANLGGFIAGTVLGVLGSAAALAWAPGDRPSKT